MQDGDGQWSCDSAAATGLGLRCERRGARQVTLGVGSRSSVARAADVGAKMRPRQGGGNAQAVGGGGGAMADAARARVSGGDNIRYGRMAAAYIIHWPTRAGEEELPKEARANRKR